MISSAASSPCWTNKTETAIVDAIGFLSHSCAIILNLGAATLITQADYYLFGFLGFIVLLLIAILGVLLRQSRAIGRVEAQYDNLAQQMRDMNARITEVESGLIGRIADVENRLTARIERLEEQMASLREQVAEVRGLLVSLHERVDLLMRHRHDDAGRVVITPEEVAAD